MNGKRKNGNEAVAYEATEIIPVLQYFRGSFGAELWERISLGPMAYHF